MDLNTAIQKRHSVRKFLSKKPDWRDIIECIDAARYAPMAGNNYTLRFILVSDKNKIQKIADATQQPFVGQMQYIVIVCSVLGRVLNSYEDKGEIFSRQQAGAAIQNFLLKIEEKGLATCWVGYFVEEEIKRELKIPENVNIEAIFPIGYELGKTIGRKKTDLDNILYFDEFGNKKMKKPKKIEV